MVLTRKNTYVSRQLEICTNCFMNKQNVKGVKIEKKAYFLSLSQRTAISSLSIVGKSDLTDKIKQDFFQAVSILLYGCTPWTLTERMMKKLDGNYTRMLRVLWNKSWEQYPTKHLLHGHLTLVSQTIPIRRTRHAGHCWRHKDKFIREVLRWTPTYAGRPERT